MENVFVISNNSRTPKRTTTGGPRYQNNTAGVDTMTLTLITESAALGSHIVVEKKTSLEHDTNHKKNEKYVHKTSLSSWPTMKENLFQ